MKTLLKITLVCIVMSFFQSCSKDDAPQIEENSAPTISDQIFIVAEDIADNIAIGTITASDPDGDALEFSISANDGDLFKISEAGVLSLNDQQTLDFETAQSHSITVAVSDGKTSTETEIIITVTDIDDTSFVTTWQTERDNENVTLPTRANEYVYDYSIDWGDGTTQSGLTNDATHTYTNAGTYTVSISGSFPAIAFSNNNFSFEYLRSVEQWGNIQWLTMFEAFFGVNTLAINATDAPDLSQVSDMQLMFAFANNISGEINNWDVSTITNMSAMFGVSSFNLDISSWDVSNVTHMIEMFKESSFNQDISGWDVSNVTRMPEMFRDSEFNQDIGGWDVSNVTEMNFMFRDSAFNQDIGGWDVSKVTDMGFMFTDSAFNQDIGGWDVSNVTAMEFMFRDSAFNQDISGWDVSNVTDCAFFADNAPLTAAHSPNFTNCTP